MPLPMFLGGIAKGIAGGAAKGAAKKFVSGKKEKKQEAKTEKKSKIKDIGQKTSKKTKTKSTPKTKKVATVKLPKSVYKDAKNAAKPTADSNVSYDSLSKQLDNINKTAGALGTQAESERQAAKENLRQSRKDAKDKKADDKEKQLEKKKGRKGEGILSVGKKIGKNFGIFDFITNVALGGLALFLLNNFDKIENLFNQLTTNLSNPFKFMQAAIVSMSTVFAGPIRGGLRLLSKPLKFAGNQVAKLAKRIAPLMKKTFANIGSGLVGFAKNTVKRITGSFTGGASGAASGVGTAASRKGQSISKATSKAGRQQGLFNRARKLYGGSKNVAKKGAGRLLKIGGVFKKIPVIGGLIGLFIDLALGEPLDRALVNAIGGGLGAWIGGGAGAFLGGGVFSWLTAPMGGIIGYEIGKWAGNQFYDMIRQKMGMLPPIDPKDMALDRASDRIPDRDRRVKGRTYTLDSGERKVWDGSKFVTPQQYQQQTGNQPSGPGTTQPYSATITTGEQDLFQRLVLAESLGEGELGMAVVARSVMNRAGLIQSGKVGKGKFLANDSSITGVIMGPRQYQPVEDGSIDKPWTDSQKALAQKAIDLAKNPQALRSALIASGVSEREADILVGSTGFRTAAAGYDASQDVNTTRFKNHLFNTAGSPTSKPVNPSMSTQQAQVTQTSQAQIAQRQIPAGQQTLTNKIPYSQFSSMTGGGKVGMSAKGDYRTAHRPNHFGVDIGTSGQKGYYVSLKTDGKVTINQYDSRGGYMVFIQVGNIEYVFMHLARKSALSVGSNYTAGTPIGEIGNTGRSFGEHLHFEVRPAGGGSGTGIDPKPYLNMLEIGRLATSDGTQTQQVQLSPNQQSSGQASSVSSRTSYDPMSQGGGGGVVPVPVPGQSGGGGGAGRSLNMGGPSTQQVLNSYYKSQLMGFLYKQG